MEINDRVYGQVNVQEPVLLELMQSNPLQRIKGVNQAGATKFVIPRRNITRFEHCVGVMLLLKQLGASTEEQIAGLLHDVPHTAFSHVVDFVFQNKNHDYHEKFHEKLIMDSEIPSILKKYGYNIGRILKKENFPLLEKDIPDLCADRIDYTLRDMVSMNGHRENVKEYCSGFMIKKNEIIMKNKSIALRFAKEYLSMDERVWSNPLEVATYAILADALRIALEKGIIKENDLFETDEYVYKKLQVSKNKTIHEKLRILNPKMKVVEDPENYEFFRKTKLRYIDPKFLGKYGKIRRVSREVPTFQKELEDHKQRAHRGFFIKIKAW